MSKIFDYPILIMGLSQEEILAIEYIRHDPQFLPFMNKLFKEEGLEVKKEDLQEMSVLYLLMVADKGLLKGMVEIRKA